MLRHRWIIGSFGISFLSLLTGMGWAYGKLGNANTPLILHFDNYAGITQIGSLADLELVGLLGLVMIGVNFLIFRSLHERDPFLGKVTATWTCILAILLFLGFAAIISVN